MNAPMTVSYARPELKQILLRAGVRVKKGGVVSVYSCGPHAFNERLRGACKEASVESTRRFELFPEVFS